MGDKPRFELSATQIIGGAVAAAGAATAASLLGVYGTVIGSAIMSVVATVGTALYGHSVQRGKQTIDRVRRTRSTGEMRRIDQTGDTPQGEPKAGDDTASVRTHDPADTPTEDLAADESAGQDGGGETVTARPNLGERLRALNWRAVSLSAAVVLVLGLGIVTVAELAMGQNMTSALTGGGDGGKHRVSVVGAFRGTGDGPTRGDTPDPPATGNEASPTASTSSPEQAPSSPPDTSTQQATTDTTKQPTTEPTTEATTEATTAPTTEPESPTEPTEGGDTSRRLVPNQRTTGADDKP